MRVNLSQRFETPSAQLLTPAAFGVGEDGDGEEASPRAAALRLGSSGDDDDDNPAFNSPPSVSLDDLEAKESWLDLADLTPKG